MRCTFSLTKSKEVGAEVMAIGNRLALVILELAETKAIKIPAQERASIEAALQPNIENEVTMEAIRALLSRRPDIVKRVGVAIVQKAFEFLDEELDYFEETKKRRILTEDELAYGRIVLPKLVQSIVSLCSCPHNTLGDDVSSG